MENLISVPNEPMFLLASVLSLFTVSNITPEWCCKETHSDTNFVALVRKLKVLTFSQNWKVTLVFTKRSPSWFTKKTLYFSTTDKTLENTILGKKHFRACHCRIHTNRH